MARMKPPAVIYCLAAALALAAACGGAGGDAPECGAAEGTAFADGDLYAIHAAIIRKDFAANAVVIIRAQAAYDDDMDAGYLGTVLKDASAEAQADFIKNNADPSKGYFEKKFSLESYELLCAAQYDHYTTGDRWDAFYEAHKGAQGILSLSAAGYNGAKDEAVVHLRNVVSTDRGEAYFVILKKEGADWNTKYRVRTWQQ